MHELDPSFVGQSAGPEQAASHSLPAGVLDWAATRQWRKETRAQLIERQLQITSADRVGWSAQIDEEVADVLASAG